jgi:hypothetical protein
VWYKRWAADISAANFYNVMHVIEIEDGLALQVSEIAKAENKSLAEFVSWTLHQTLHRKRPNRTDEEKVKRFAESYEEKPQQPEEYMIWQDEQVWED